jgi:hypothetical protein
MNSYCNAYDTNDQVTKIQQCNLASEYVTIVARSEAVKALLVFQDIDAFLTNLKTSNPESYNVLSETEGVFAHFATIEPTVSNFNHSVSTHYANSDSWFLTANGKETIFTALGKNISTEAELHGGTCDVVSFTKPSATSSNIDASLKCSPLLVDSASSNPQKSNYSSVISISGVNKAAGKYGYVFKISADKISVVPNLPAGDWQSYCNLDDTSLIGPKDPQFGNHRMILKTKCVDPLMASQVPYTYLDLRTVAQVHNAGGLIMKDRDSGFISSSRMRDATRYVVDKHNDKLDGIYVDKGGFVPSGSYSDDCKIEHVSVSRENSSSMVAHAIVSCMNTSYTYEYSKGFGTTRAEFGPHLINIYQDEIVYKIHHNDEYGYTTKTNCMMNSSYDVFCTGDDLISFSQIAWTKSTPSYRGMYFYSPINDVLEEEFNSYGVGSHPFYSVSSDRLSSVYSSDTYKDELYWKRANHTFKYQQFWNKVEEIQDK